MDEIGKIALVDLYKVIFSLQGKLLNVKKASKKKILDNTEIHNLKEVIGLKDDKEYRGVSGLRYGRIIVMGDPDVDGLHFNTFVINLIHTFWPSLPEIKRLLFAFSTPILKVKFHGEKAKGKGKEKEKVFYSKPYFESWKKDNNIDATKCNVKYYKVFIYLYDGRSYDGEVRAYDFHYNSAGIRFQFDSSLHTARLRQVDDYINVNSAEENLCPHFSHFNIVHSHKIDGETQN